MSPNPHRRLTSAAGVLVLALAGVSVGQHGDERDSGDARRRMNGLVFDAEIYGVRNSVSREESIRAYRARLRDTLEARAGNDAFQRNLAPAEEQKLRRAGRHDIKKLFDWLDDKRSTFEGMDFRSLEGQQFRLKLRAERSARVQRLFDAGSFYAKVLNTVDAADTRTALDPREAEGVGR